MSDLQPGKLSFFQKADTVCPVCNEPFKEEVLRVGGGRMIAGKLDLDLRRHYEASKKFGEVHPVIYSVLTCPHCYYSAMTADFPNPDPKAIGKLQAQTDERKASIPAVFTDLDFQRPRTLQEGAAGYFLALMCYELWSPNFAPTLKMAICALRTAWIYTTLHGKFPGENFDYLAKIFFHKARFLYSQVVEKETKGKENASSVAHMGPDTDVNYGYDGVLYLAAYLEYKYGEIIDAAARNASLSVARRTIAKLVGMGKSSKSKPSVLLEMAKDLHHEIGEILKEDAEEEDPYGDEPEDEEYDPEKDFPR